MFKQINLTLVVTATLSFASASLAVDEYNTATGLTATGAPLAFHGIDPVAFIDIENRISGTARYAAVHDGVAYYFSSQENAAKFEKNPSRYQPQNGGFCTFGVSVGKKFDGDPQYADIVDNKLYVFLNEDIYKEYLKDRTGTIQKAEKNWQKIRHSAAASL